MSTSFLLHTWTRLPSLPDKEGFAGCYAGVSHETLLVTGGANFPDKALWEGGTKTWTDAVFALKSAEDTWQKVGQLPHPYGYGASATVKEGLLCLGGCDKEGHRKNVYHLSLKNGELLIEEWAELPVPLAYMSAVVLQNKVYVFGGCTAPGEQDASSSLYSLDLDCPLSAWKEETPIPARGRFLYEMAVFQDKLYVAGGIALKDGPEGRKVRDLLTETWAFSPGEGWQRLALDLPRPCAAAPSPAPVDSKGNMYLIGGDDGALAGFSPIQDHPGFPSQCLVFDTAQHAWVETGAIPASRAVLPCCFWQGAFILINGEMRPGKRSPEVWALS